MTNLDKAIDGLDELIKATWAAARVLAIRAIGAGVEDAPELLAYRSRMAPNLDVLMDELVELRAMFEKINAGICPECNGQLSDNGVCQPCHFVPALDDLAYQRWAKEKRGEA